MTLWGRFHLIGRKEKEIVRLFNDHIAIVLKAVEMLRGLVASAWRDDWASVEDTADLIAKYESQADSIHREAVAKISRGTFFAGMREDFLNLLEQIDEIADAAQNAARILAQARVEPQILQHVFTGEHKALEELIEKVMEAVRLTASSVVTLQEDSEEAVAKSLEVEKVEEEADEIKVNLIKKLYSERSRLDVLTLLQLKDFILKLDEIADAAEDCSDQIVMIVAKAYA